MALYRPRHRHFTGNSNHSFRVRILTPSLCFPLPISLFSGPQQLADNGGTVSACYSLRWLMSRCLLLHDFNIGRVWRYTALSMDILRINHLIPFVFVFLHRFFIFHYRWIYSLVRSAAPVPVSPATIALISAVMPIAEDLRLPEGTVPFLFKASCQGGPVVQILESKCSRP